jgi:hypothetical protein
VPGPIFGHISGYPVGSWFENRAELADASVHRHRQAGISGSADEGADSIVLFGGYEDDEDHGDVIVYTSYGGRDPDAEKQVSDQPFRMWNRALAYSSLNGLPVRVIRGAGHDSPHSPGAGYGYDGQRGRAKRHPGEGSVPLRSHARGATSSRKSDAPVRSAEYARTGPPLVGIGLLLEEA